MRRLKDLLSDKKHVIWDWNGTLLNDVGISTRAINSLLAEYGLPRINLETYKKTFGFPVKDFYVRIGFDFSKHDWEVVARKFVDQFYSSLGDCGLHAGVRELLEELKTADRKQSILSASQEPELHRLLELYGLDHLFDHAYGLSDHYAGSKLERGRQLIAIAGVAPAQTILIGDTDHDLQVGRELGIEVLLLAQGHQDYERLKDLHENVIEF